MEKELKTRKTVVATGKDILRRGYQRKDMFTIQEGYYNKAHHRHNIVVPIWRKNWSLKYWPKVEHFLWLQSHRKILAWDQLQWRGMYGPSLFHMRNRQAETIEHLLNTYEMAETF